MQLRTRNFYLLAFVASGFSGLIYESVWTHYLKLYLGHVAYAQTLVLALFMGGIAAGSLAASRVTERWTGPLKLYALVEGAIGLLALLFHQLFLATTTLSFDTIIPALAAPWSIQLFKCLMAALLIFPQSMLLGMTFPLMTAGVIRAFPEKPGKTVSLLYFTNSIGAACGILASGFVLIRFTGLPGALQTAGVINICLALVVWYLASHEHVGHYVPVTDGPPEPLHRNRGYYGFLLAALVTGAASFIYEVGWIRMLSLVLGSSSHAFELMVCAFILGLALGALWVQRTIDMIPNPVRYLGLVQVWMGLGALSTLLMYGQTFEFMSWFIKLVEKTDRGYTLFSLTSNGVALAVMLPTTFCAGMTLPLITAILLKKGAGERSIGAVYAANTLGAIGGVFVAIHLLMPVVGLKNLIATGSALDLLLGIYLLWLPAPGPGRSRLIISAIALATLACAVFLVDLDHYKMASGVFRKGSLLADERLDYYRDGKTASISVTTARDGWRSIRSNGKPDASVMMVGADDGRTSSDEPTQILLGALPLALLPDARSAAVIGLGSGVTANTLLKHPGIGRVDTIEIEQSVVEAARLFQPFNELLYTDPRSSIHIDDAKTFFSKSRKKYDLIVSEPSNPWVSGVASLFSTEFYKVINSHLDNSGLFVQWVHLYEMDCRLIAAILKAISANFADYAVYSTSDYDMMIVAGKRAQDWTIDPAIFKHSGISADLKRVDIRSSQDFTLRRQGTKAILDPLLTSIRISPNSDYYPVLDQNAERSRFLGETAEWMFAFTYFPIPLQEILSHGKNVWAKNEVTPSIWFKKSRDVVIAMGIRDIIVSGSNQGGAVVSKQDRGLALQVRALYHDCGGGDEQQSVKLVFEVMQRIIPYLTGNEFRGVVDSLQRGKCARKNYPQVERLMSFLADVSSRNPDRIVAAANMFLPYSGSYSAEIQRYAVSWMLAGHLANGSNQEALKLLAEYGPKVFPPEGTDLFVSFVRAKAGAGH